jgi:hypothetical protein
MHPTGEMALSVSEKKRAFVGRCCLAFFDTSGITTSSVMVRRTCLDAVGTFDETLPTCEDHDLWLRISRRFDLALIDAPLVLYRYFPVGGPNLSNNRIKMAESEARLWSKTVREDPGLVALIGRGRMNLRLASLHAYAGSLRTDAGMFREARRHYWRAFVHSPSDVKSLVKCGVTCLPRGLTSRLFALKRTRIGGLKPQSCNAC